MAYVKIMMAWEFHCTACALAERSTNKASLISTSVSHAIYSHGHANDDGCGCDLVRAVNNPAEVFWAFLVPLQFA